MAMPKAEGSPTIFESLSYEDRESVVGYLIYAANVLTVPVPGRRAPHPREEQEFARVVGKVVAPMLAERGIGSAFHSAEDMAKALGIEDVFIDAMLQPFDYFGDGEMPAEPRISVSG